MKVYFLKTCFIIMVIALLTGCDKKLDQKPQQTIDAANALVTADDIESAMIGCYSIIAGGQLYGTNLNSLPELLASDNYCSWRGTFVGPRQVANKTMLRDNSEASRTWIAGYNAINMANTVLDNLGLVTSATQKSKLEGEALCIRAIMHFELVRLYALPFDPLVSNSQLGVPIITKSTKTEADAFTYPARNTVNEVYNAVIADLTAAVGKLPTANSTRIDRFVAQAFLARVYLQKADYANALTAANAVISSGKYQMNAAVLAAFTNKGTKESVFEIQQNDQNNAGTSNDGLATFYSSLPGVGRADIRMNTTFLNIYPASDLRRSEWYYVGTGARPGNLYCGKWQSFSQNIPVIRIAEMYLIRAETNLRLGSNVGATPAADIAQVRNVVRTSLTPIAAPVLNDVLNERRLELAFEGLRIHDIRRLKSASGAFPWNDAKLVLPIPQREMDANKSLVQNPGY